MADNEKKVSEEKSKKAAPKKNKVGFFGRIKKFFKDYKSELHKVVWLNPKTTFQYTGLILVVMVIVSAFIGCLDVIFVQLLDLLSKLV